MLAEHLRNSPKHGFASAFVMTAIPPPSEPPHPSGVTWNVDRARLLRDATTDFIRHSKTGTQVSARYEALARGFLPQIKRETAIDIARMLAGCPHLTQGIVDAFASLGIGIKFSLSTGREQRAAQTGKETAPETQEDPAMSDHRFFAGPLMDARSSSAPAHNHAHLDPYGLTILPLDAVQVQALTRAAERRDIADFSSLAVQALLPQNISATPEAITRMLRDTSGEPSALLMHAMGGDRILLIKTVQAFVRDCPSITATVRQTLAFFETLAPEQARSIVATYFGATSPKKRQAAQHFTVQSGQSLHLRATGAAHKTAGIVPLSQRLTATLKR